MHLLPFLSEQGLLHSLVGFLVEFLANLWVISNDSFDVTFLQYPDYAWSFCRYICNPLRFHEYCNFTEKVSLAECFQHSSFVSSNNRNLTLNHEIHFFTLLILDNYIVSWHVDDVLERERKFSNHIIRFKGLEHWLKNIFLDLKYHFLNYRVWQVTLQIICLEGLLFASQERRVRKVHLYFLSLDILSFDGAEKAFDLLYLLDMHLERAILSDMHLNLCDQSEGYRKEGVSNVDN